MPPVIVTGTLRTTTGTQDFTVSGVGTIDSYMVFLNRATSLNTTESEMSNSIGWTDGTDQQCLIVRADDGLTPVVFDWARVHLDTRYVAALFSPTGGTAQTNVTHNAFITDGVRLNVGATGGGAYRIGLVLFPASPYSGKVALISEGAGTTNITSIGQESDMVFGLSMSQAGVGTSGSGICEPAVGVSSPDGSISIAYRPASFSDAVFYASGISQTAICETVDFNSFDKKSNLNNYDSSGFDIVNTGDPQDIGVLSMNSGAFGIHAQLIDTPTSTGVQTYSGMTFTPGFVVAFSTNDSSASVDTYNTTGPFGSYGFGAGDETSSFCSLGVVEDNSNPSNTGSRFEDKLIAIADPTSSSLLVAGTVDSFAADEVNINFTTVDGTARKVLLVSFENDAATSSEIRTLMTMGVGR